MPALVRTAAVQAMRSLVPTPLKRKLRGLLDNVAERRRATDLKRGINELRTQAIARRVTRALIADIHEAWGNVDWSADAAFVGEGADRALASPGPFLDCGSGLTTVVVGVIADQLGTRVWSLEQDLPWYRRMRSVLAKYEILSVDLRYAPLRSYGEYAWYDVDERSFPRTFTHIFCDGPAVFPNDWPEPLHSNWRAGVVSALQAMGVGFDSILLDDAEDPRSATVRERWLRLGIKTEVISSPTGAFIASL
jgi:hypothetical protein